MQALIESLSQQQLNNVISMVDLDMVDNWTFNMNELIQSIEMFGYSEEDIINAVTSTEGFVYSDDYEPGQYESAWECYGGLSEEESWAELYAELND